MKTSFFNGINTGKLDFDYNIRYRPRIDVSELGMKRQIEYLFRNITYDHLCFVWENDRYTKHKHSHTLVKTTDDNLILQLKDNIQSSKDPIIGTRMVTYQKERTLINPKNGEKRIDRIDCIGEVGFTELQGRHGVVYVEPIMSNVSSSIYTHKFTDRGVNYGYIKPTLIYQTPL
jgi:hypothetical protein